MFSARLQKPLKELTQRELRVSVVAICAFATFFLTAAGLLIWQIGVLSFPVFFCGIMVLVCFVASRPSLLELRQRKRPQL
jgi:fatty acid desaturase